MYEEGAHQVYQKLGVSSRGSIDVGNCIHIHSVSQLKKDAHNRPREELSIGAGQYWWNQVSLLQRGGLAVPGTSVTESELASAEVPAVFLCISHRVFQYLA